MVEVGIATKLFCGERVFRIINPGSYHENDLVEVCYDEDLSNNSIGAAQAHYIVYGYHLGDLGEYVENIN